MARRSARRSARRALFVAALVVSAASPLAAQGTRGIAACSGGGTGHARVAPLVDAVFVYERCVSGDRIAAITLWRARTPAWSANPDAVAFDQRDRTLVVTARDGAHPLVLGRTDSVLVVMLDWADAIAGPIPLQTTRLAPARASGIVPPLGRETTRDGVSDSLRTLLMRNGRSRRFLQR